MSFDVDAIIGLPAPPPARPGPASTSEAGESFAEHLAEAAPEETPVEAASAPPEENTELPADAREATLAIAPQAAPAPATPAPIVVQVIASTPAPLVAPSPEAVPEASQAEAAPQATPVVAAPPVVAPVTTKKAATPPTLSAEPVLAEDGAPTEAVAAPKVETPKAAPATPIQAASQDSAASAPQAATTAPVEQVQSTPMPVVATAPIVEAAEPAPVAPDAARVDPDASRNAAKAAPELAGHEVKPAAPQPLNIAKAAPSPAAMKESFAAALAATQADAPETNAPTQTSQPASIAASSTQAGAPQHVAHEQAVARAAPAAWQVGREIVRRFNGESTRFELRLDPPELGRVEVRLDVSRDHRVTAVVAADSPQALAELSRHARELEAALQSAGLQLNDNGLSFDLSRQREGGDTEQAQGASGANTESDETQEAASLLARPIGLERWRGVRVDVMA
jgi:hypothetical protein